MAATIQGTEQVPIDSLAPYPGNARRGDVAVIGESLQVLGQYRPIVANRRDGTILRGNHTWRAARLLGWDTIQVSWVDVDPEQARRIVLADNRLHDLGTDDKTLLLGLLEPLPDLLGTGYTENDLLLMRTEDEIDSEGKGGGSGEQGGPVAVQVGPYHLTVARDGWDPWAQALSASCGDDREMIVREVRRRLWLPPDEAQFQKATKRKTGRKMPARSPAKFTLTDVSQESTASLRLYAGNARQGDIGAIAASLTANGQYSPIVARTGTREVLVGNHTVQAAMALGWDRIAVCWVDVDDTTAAKIVVADNRTASLGSYDTAALLALLIDSADDLDGTGYDGDDIDDLLAEANRTPVTGAKDDDKPVAVNVGPWKTRATPAEWAAWHAQTVDSLGTDRAQVCDGIASALNLPDHSWEMA